jgi:hypothetical protein
MRGETETATYSFPTFFGKKVGKEMFMTKTVRSADPVPQRGFDAGFCLPILQRVLA